MSKRNNDVVIPVSLLNERKNLTGRVRLAFFIDDPEDERHKYTGCCGCFMTRWDAFLTAVTRWWVAEGGVEYTHVEMMFSDGTVVSATRSGGVHVLEHKLLSNRGYDKFVSVKVTPRAEKIMLDKAHSLKGKPFNNLGRIWNNVDVLAGLKTIDTEQEAFYCSELATFLLKIGAAVDNTQMCAPLDHRTTNPTQLYLHLTRNKYAVLDWNEKESLARGEDARQVSGFLADFISIGSRRKRKKEKGSNLIV